MLKNLNRSAAISTALGLAVLSPAAVNAEEQDTSGIWQSIGYGLWFDIGADSATIYQTTETTCLEFVTIPEVAHAQNSASFNNALMAGLGAYLGPQNYEVMLKDGLLNFEIGKVNPIQSTHVDSLPETCATPTENTPENTFETYWKFFNEHFAFFELRGMDWQAAYDTYRPQVTPETSDEELFEIIQDMIAPLGDGHVSIISPDGDFQAVELPNWAEGLEEEDLPAFAMLAADNYLQEDAKFLADGTFIYGKLTDEIGYINILGFDGQMGEGGDTTLLAETMDTILAELGDLDDIVIDIRINFGGDDTAGLFVAEYFALTQQTVMKKSLWVEGEFQHIMDIDLIPNDHEAYLGNIHLLTSRLTISAAETFALSMAQLPNVMLVGEPTNGMLSDMFFIILPNGWIGTTSNEQYLSADDALYESIGVPIDVAVTWTQADVTAGHDPMVEKVLEMLAD